MIGHQGDGQRVGAVRERWRQRDVGRHGAGSADGGREGRALHEPGVRRCEGRGQRRFDLADVLHGYRDAHRLAGRVAGAARGVGLVRDGVGGGHLALIAEDHRAALARRIGEVMDAQRVAERQIVGERESIIARQREGLGGLPEARAVGGGEGGVEAAVIDRCGVVIGEDEVHGVVLGQVIGRGVLDLDLHIGRGRVEGGVAVADDVTVGIAQLSTNLIEAIRRRRGPHRRVLLGDGAVRGQRDGALLVMHDRAVGSYRLQVQRGCVVRARDVGQDDGRRRRIGCAVEVSRARRLDLEPGGGRDGAEGGGVEALPRAILVECGDEMIVGVERAVDDAGDFCLRRDISNIKRQRLVGVAREVVADLDVAAGLIGTVV